MQYYIKIFNTKTDELVGFYKETGKNNISRLKNGIKYFSNLDEALYVARDMDDGFMRDVDKHYYNAFVAVYGDNSRTPSKSYYIKEKEREMNEEFKATIRQIGRNIEGQTRNDF